MRGLKNKVAIITGGLGDLGYATGKRLAEEGCSVALLDTKVEPGRAEEIGCRSWVVDLLDEDQIRSACRSVMDTMGAASILVNSAARFILKGIEASPQEWDDMAGVNIRGASLMAKHVVLQM